MHGQHHDAAEQDEQGIRALFKCFHENLFGELPQNGAKKSPNHWRTNIKQFADQMRPSSCTSARDRMLALASILYACADLIQIAGAEALELRSSAKEA